jgi:outer membrane protein assembly factor BamB
MTRCVYAPVLALALVSACEIPSWMGGDPPEITRIPGERYEVLASDMLLKPNEESQRTPVDIPEATANDDWRSPSAAMASGVPALPKTLAQYDSASIGEGNDFGTGDAIAPIAAEGALYAMDAAGFVSAHALGDISDKRWVSDAATEEDDQEILGGGLAYDAGTLYATTGYGRLVALDAATGKKRWRSNVGAPVRGAPAVKDGIVVVLTADNQTLAFDTEKGGPIWEHRGIREAAGFFSGTSPVIAEDLVIGAYSSGQIVALRLTNGNVLWEDSVGTPTRTRAASTFSGIDATPVVQDGVVYVVSAGGVMMANALINGRPLWSQRLGAHETPWASGNALFVLTIEHELAALFKRDGMVRWATGLKQTDKGRDITPTLYGPVLAGGRVLIASAEGNLLQFSTADGKAREPIDLPSGIAATPIIVNGTLFLVTEDATLYAYR